MESFEELINQLKGMSEEERSQKIKELEVDCVCPICPTYNDCAKKAGQNLFCVQGKSNCIEKERGCMCPTCPFAANHKIGVMRNTYCIRGPEMEQRQL